MSHSSGPVSASAMALILARGRRRDRFGQCLVAFDDLSAESAELLTQRIAAAMRAGLDGRPDAELASAMASVLAQRDDARGSDALIAELVALLDRDGALTDELILAAAHEGEVAFLAHILARRAGIPAESAVGEMLSATSDRIISLLRASGASRSLSAGLLASIGDLLGIEDPAGAIEIFDTMTAEQEAAARSWLSTSPAYRAALAALGEGHGQRSV